MRQTVQSLAELSAKCSEGEFRNTQKGIDLFTEAESGPSSPILRTRRESFVAFEDQRIEKSLGSEPTRITVSKSSYTVSPVKGSYLSLANLPSVNTKSTLKMVATYILHLYLVFLERKQHILMVEDDMKHAVASAIKKMQSSESYRRSLQSLVPNSRQFRRHFTISKGIPQNATNAEIIVKQWRHAKTGPQAMLFQDTEMACREMFLKCENAAKEVTSRSMSLKTTKITKKTYKALRNLKKLLLKYAKYDYPIEDMMTTKPFPTKPYEREHSELFIKAVKKGNMKTVTELLGLSKYLVFAFDWTHLTALHWAAKRGNLQMLEYLIDCKSDLEAEDDMERTALFYAVTLNHIDCCLALVKAGARYPVKLRVKKVLESPALQGNMVKVVLVLFKVWIVTLLAGPARAARLQMATACHKLIVKMLAAKDEPLPEDKAAN